MITKQPALLQLRDNLEKVIIGQSKLVDRLLISILTGGHLLLEGPPGLAKTTAVKALANSIHAEFQRIQFTPDLLPADLTGGEIYDPEKRQFEFIKGPIFNEIILADEINRAPPKIQSALLEAMQEHQVTINGITRALPPLFIVMATQNPLEQSGTYPLPEAQLDRFLLHTQLDYPSTDNELTILKQDRVRYQKNPLETDIQLNESQIKPEHILNERQIVADTHIDEKLEKYIVELVSVTRNPEIINPDYKDYVDYGASPRASLALYKAASAMAYLNDRDYLIPEDIHNIIHDVLRHRIILNYAASANHLSVDRLIDELVKSVATP